MKSATAWHEPVARSFTGCAIAEVHGLVLPAAIVWIDTKGVTLTRVLVSLASWLGASPLRGAVLWCFASSPASRVSPLRAAIPRANTARPALPAFPRGVR
jgi:hypothetical protein